MNPSSRSYRERQDKQNVEKENLTAEVTVKKKLIFKIPLPPTADRPADTGQTTARPLQVSCSHLPPSVKAACKTAVEKSSNLTIKVNL